MKRNAEVHRRPCGESPARRFSSRTASASFFFLASLLLGAVAAGAQGPAETEKAIKAPLVAKSLLLDSTRAGKSLVVVGERGHILISRDGGGSWAQAEVPTRSTLTAVYFHDEKLGWAAGHDAVILRTRDGGTSWERVHWAPEAEAPFLDLWFADATNGFAVGAYGRCFVTADGGTTWTERRVSEEDFHLNQIARAASGRLYIAAESGQVFRSDDGGVNWSQTDTAYSGSFFGILPLENASVLVFGLRGHLFRSDDGGTTWTRIETGTSSMLNSAIRLADGRIVIVGLGGTVLVSEDGGRSFALREQSSRSGIQSVVDAGNGQLVLTGEHGVRQQPVSGLEK